MTTGIVKLPQETESPYLQKIRDAIGYEIHRSSKINQLPSSVTAFISSEEDPSTRKAPEDKIIEGLLISDIAALESAGLLTSGAAALKAFRDLMLRPNAS